MGDTGLQRKLTNLVNKPTNEKARAFIEDARRIMAAQTGQAFGTGD
jgi:hypothetical protein